MADQALNTLTLYQFRRFWGLPNASPFCLKVETYLRMAGIPYRAVATRARRGPRRKLPFVEVDGRRIADSSLIIEHLEKRMGSSLDLGLDHEKRALATSIQRLIEDHLFWIELYTRWLDDGWDVTRATYFATLPRLLRPIIARLARRAMRSKLDAHGIARHTREDIYAMARADLDSIQALLADKPYLTGTQPRSVDASAFGLLANILWAPVESPTRDYLRSQSPLVAYLQRIREGFYGDPQGRELWRSTATK